MASFFHRLVSVNDPRVHEEQIVENRNRRRLSTTSRSSSSSPERPTMTILSSGPWLKPWQTRVHEDWAKFSSHTELKPTPLTDLQFILRKPLEDLPDDHPWGQANMFAVAFPVLDYYVDEYFHAVLDATQVMLLKSRHPTGLLQLQAMPPSSKATVAGLSTNGEFYINGALPVVSDRSLQGRVQVPYDCTQETSDLVPRFTSHAAKKAEQGQGGKRALTIVFEFKRVEEEDHKQRLNWRRVKFAWDVNVRYTQLGGSASMLSQAAAWFR